MKKIIVIFKTHLDIGFTDFPDAVVKNYIENYIPRAMQCALEMRGKKQRFIWTTGSWLIEHFLETAAPEQIEKMEDAIAHGEISWHGLPATSHSEALSRELLQYDLSISRKLDQRFGKHTIGAKMTDVPGHTRAIVPELVHAGIRFLHIGVNPASSVAQVPPVFRWRCETGEELLVMINGSYGEATEIPGADTMVFFAHTNDNLGPQNKEEITALYRSLNEQYPEAQITAGTLNDLAETVMSVSDQLPVVTSEIGDSWIHGVGSDPGKMRRYRELLRLCKDKPQNVRDAVYKHLMLVPEHTWGLDEKSFLGTFLENEAGEPRFYIRSEFEQVRHTEKFRRMEQSWEAQRDYVRDAVRVYTEMTGETVHFPRAVLPDVTDFEKLPVSEPVCIGEYCVQFAPNGAVCALSRAGRTIADENHLLGELIYQAFSAQEVNDFQDAYLTSHVAWAVEDFGKPGMEKANVPASRIPPVLTALYRKGCRLAAMMEYTGIEYTQWGAPARVAAIYDFLPDEIKIELIWNGKPANRLPEALWFGFNPMDNGLKISKLSHWIDPADVVERGGRRLHGSDYGAKFDHCAVEALDNPVLCVGRPALLQFNNNPIPVNEGVFFNLFNNVWGTNFVMWYDEDEVFRYRMTF